MTIEPQDATHIRLKVAVYPSSEFLAAGTIHKVTEYAGHAWRVVDPAYPDDRMKDYWIEAEAGIAEPVPDPDEGRPLLAAPYGARRRLLDGDSVHRKEFPLATGLLDYFPDALAEVARVSKRGNDKHNPGQPMHHARGKSMDHADCIMRHLAGRGGFDGDTRESASLAWRALALLQEELEAEMGLPLPRGARPAEPDDMAARAAVEGTPVPEDHPVDPAPEVIPAFLPKRAEPLVHTRPFPPRADNPHIPTTEEEKRTYKELGF